MFKEVNIEDLSFNPFTKIGKQWMLVSAGDEKGYNMLTASWGGMGVLWGCNTVTAYIRQSRYTKKFIDSCDKFALSFFDEEYKNALSICGTKSGRDTDKAKEANITPYFIEDTTAFNEAKMIIICSKIYADVMNKENFIDKEADEKFYADKDYHTLYIGKIEKVLINE